jgi:hypothetical protein
MDKLPKELIAKVLSDLEPQEVLRLETVCRLWRRISLEDEPLWQTHYQKLLATQESEEPSSVRHQNRCSSLTAAFGLCRRSNSFFTRFFFHDISF